MINSDRTEVQAPIIRKKYRTPEVLEKLGIIFKNKCYLCEKKLGSTELFEIDHFITQNEDPSKLLDWNNLYLCCGECNKMRPKITPMGGYLDPCNSDHDVECDIKYELPEYELDMPIFIPSRDDLRIYNTIELLKSLHYGNGTTRLKTAALRDMISKEATKLVILITKESNAKHIGNRDEYWRCKQEIEYRIDSTYPFCMFMRYIENKYRIK